MVFSFHETLIHLLISSDKLVRVQLGCECDEALFQLGWRDVVLHLKQSVIDRHPPNLLKHGCGSRTHRQADVLEEIDSRRRLQLPTAVTEQRRPANVPISTVLRLPYPPRLLARQAVPALTTV